MSRTFQDLANLKGNLEYLQNYRSIADPDYWLRVAVGEDGLRSLYLHDVITVTEFEKWMDELVRLTHWTGASAHG